MMRNKLYNMPSLTPNWGDLNQVNIESLVKFVCVKNTIRVVKLSSIHVYLPLVSFEMC